MIWDKQQLLDFINRTLTGRGIENANPYIYVDRRQTIADPGSGTLVADLSDKYTFLINYNLYGYRRRMTAHDIRTLLKETYSNASISFDVIFHHPEEDAAFLTGECAEFTTHIQFTDEPDLSPEYIESLIDYALQIKDETWFRELSLKYTALKG
ncbi:hypothetical protein Q5741_07995 [Paenibacillus sp. JX-17]|uniref:IDEAL domain-containing protein n=1 Tax=Paenibacillus lacisoli TaxID=3064525 RepID=A0ABT9CFH9_9BACL|nr:hypothetical protein [Paenibacillus sp. JX-17]MDO7906358.1 hypothetical protein [Paenibacillus sp. JX-17]